MIRSSRSSELQHSSETSYKKALFPHLPAEKLQEAAAEAWRRSSLLRTAASAQQQETAGRRKGVVVEVAKNEESLVSAVRSVLRIPNIGVLCMWCSGKW